MTTPDIEALKNTVEILKTVKPLYEEPSSYLPVYAALIGAFVGAVATFIPSYILSAIRDRHDKKSTTLRLYAEVKSTLEIMAYRGYLEQIELIVSNFEQEQCTSCIYQIQISEDNFPIYRSSLAQLGILDVDLQVRLVKFYGLLEAAIQDVKPGGLLNASPAGKNEFEELRRIVAQATHIGGEIVCLISQRYNLKEQGSSPLGGGSFTAKL